MDIGAYAHGHGRGPAHQAHDDLTTSLVQAEVDGEQLTSAEIASFFILLAVAGNETTRNAISHGVLALTRYPDERQNWWADFDGLAHTAVEEVVRWASPVIYMRRTLTRDFELSGDQMAEGDKVTLWYCSANRDEAKFADPWRFDVRRNPNPQVGLRRRGSAFLPRRQSRPPRDQRGVRRVAPPDARHRRRPASPRGSQSSFIHGIKRLPIGWTPPR